MDFTFVDEICQQYLENRYFPSVVVSVFDQNKTLYRKAMGCNPGYELNTDTMYDMASLSKIATATQILMLMDAGQLTLETRVAEVLPEIATRPALGSRLREVTLYQLLTHSSGIIDWYPFYVQKGRDFYDVFNSFIGDTPVAEGTLYSDMNFMLLGKVLEKVKGKSLQECLGDLKEYLGAERMEYCPTNLENVAPSSYGNGIEEEMCRERNLTFTGWRSKEMPVLGGVNDGNAHYFFDDAAGHAGVFANADAYERLGRLYLNTSLPLMKQSMTEQEDGRGLGWQVEPTLFPEGCGHTGFTGTSLWLCPEKGIGVVALTNRLCFADKPGTNTNEFRRALHQAIVKRL